jgi:molybdopterin-guanine dinucleotide biosynthesis protein A
MPCHTVNEAPMFSTAVILAGGASRRMGFDKQTLSFDGRPLIERTVELFRELFDDIVIVTDRPQLYRDKKVRVVSDVFPGCGPMAGIHAGLLQAKSLFVYVIGCDMPYPEPNYINLMKRKLESAAANSVAGCMMRRDTGCLEPLNAFYNVALTDAMARSLENGERSLQSFCRDRPFIWVKEDEARAILITEFLQITCPDFLACQTVHRMVADQKIQQFAANLSKLRRVRPYDHTVFRQPRT